MAWTLFKREPRFPRLRRLLNWTFLVALIGGAGVGVYFAWPWIQDTVIPWLQSFGSEVEEGS